MMAKKNFSFKSTCGYHKLLMIQNKYNENKLGEFYNLCLCNQLGWFSFPFHNCLLCRFNLILIRTINFISFSSDFLLLKFYCCWGKAPQGCLKKVPRKARKIRNHWFIKMLKINLFDFQFSWILKHFVKSNVRHRLIRVKTLEYKS
jgi:hypothetical protein